MVLLTYFCELLSGDTITSLAEVEVTLIPLATPFHLLYHSYYFFFGGGGGNWLVVVTWL